MTKSAFEKIAAGLQDAINYVDGARDGYATHIPETIDLKAIRGRLHLSQPKFAATFGFTVGRVRDWEQGRFPIDASSRALLTIIDREPEAAMRALSARERFAASHQKRHSVSHAGKVKVVASKPRKMLDSHPKGSGKTAAKATSEKIS